MVVVDQIDELFQYPHLSAVPQFCMNKKTGGKYSKKFNSGLLVLQPSRNTFNELLNLFNDYSPEWSWADQCLLNYYYKDNWNELPDCYNKMKRIFHHKPEWWTLNTIKIVHFAGGKPWQNEDDLKVFDFENNNIYSELFNFWWSIFNNTCKYPLKESLPLPRTQ